MICVKCSGEIQSPLIDRKSGRENPWCSACRQDKEANRVRAKKWAEDPENKGRRNLRLAAKRRGVELKLTKKEYRDLGWPKTYDDYLAAIAPSSS